MTSNNGAGDTLGSQLREARKARGLTLDELAAEIGTTRRQLIRWESDENTPTKAAHRESLAKALRLPVGFFDEAAQPVEVRLSRRLAALERAVARIERRLFGEDVAQGR